MAKLRRHPLQESLEAAQATYLKAGIHQTSTVVRLERNPAVPLDAGHGRYSEGRHPLLLDAIDEARNPLGVLAT